MPGRQAVVTAGHGDRTRDDASRATRSLPWTAQLVGSRWTAMLTPRRRNGIGLRRRPAFAGRRLQTGAPARMAPRRHSLDRRPARTGPISRGRARGGVAERLKAAVLKTARGREAPRGFESHPLRQPNHQVATITAPALPCQTSVSSIRQLVATSSQDPPPLESGHPRRHHNTTMRLKLPSTFVPVALRTMTNTAFALPARSATPMNSAGGAPVSALAGTATGAASVTSRPKSTA